MLEMLDAKNFGQFSQSELYSRWWSGSCWSWWRIMSVNLYYNAINISQPWTPLFISGRGSLEPGNTNDDMKRGGH